AEEPFQKLFGFHHAFVIVARSFKLDAPVTVKPGATDDLNTPGDIDASVVAALVKFVHLGVNTDGVGRHQFQAPVAELLRRHAFGKGGLHRLEHLGAPLVWEVSKVRKRSQVGTAYL